MPKALVTLEIALPPLEIDGKPAAEGVRLRIPVPVRWADGPRYAGLSAEARANLVEDEARCLALDATLGIKVEDLGDAGPDVVADFDAVGDSLREAFRRHSMAPAKLAAKPKGKGAKPPAAGREAKAAKPKARKLPAGPPPADPKPKAARKGGRK